MCIRDRCKLLSYKGKVFSVEIPNFIELEVTQTEPGVKGNTATNTCLLYTSSCRMGGI